MADISITAGNVTAVSGSPTATGTAGETLTAGQLVYLKSSDGRLWKADNSTAAKAALAGIVLNGASAGQAVTYSTPSIQGACTVNMGGTLVLGQTYVASATAGGLAPVSDLTTGYYVTLTGVAITTGALLFLGCATGIQRA